MKMLIFKSNLKLSSSACPASDAWANFCCPLIHQFVYIGRRTVAMARNNVFKLSGNMALGSSDPYSNNDFDNIKSSLKLLKSKQPQRQQAPQPTDYYGGSYSSSIPQRQAPSKLSSNDYQNYNYQQSNNRGAGSYKDVYQQMEQHYPKNDYKPSKPSKDYEYQERNDYPRQKPQQRQEEYNPRGQQSNQRNQPQRQQDYRQQDNYRQDNYRQDNYRQGKGSSYEQRNIKEINRENRIEIKQYDPSELVQCSEGCGRKFNPDSIAKHEGICRQVFQKKRKAFNAQEQRIIANQQKKLIKKGQAIEKKLEERKAREKIPKWKAESLQLRAGLKQARNEDYQPTRQQKELLDASRPQLTKCQFCGRSFNEEAARKHIPFCEAQQKKNQMRRR